MLTANDQDIAFPFLSDHEMTCLAALGKERRFADGETMFSSGDRDYSLFAIRSGEVVILDNSSGGSTEIVTHVANTFTGDVDLLTGRPAIVSAVARGDCQVIEITACKIRRMLGEVPTLSDKLLEAFQARRAQLERSGFLGIRVIGETDSKKTLELREFFYKNKVPHTFYECDSDEGQSLLSEHGVPRDETPVLWCGKNLVEQPTLAKVADCLGISRSIRDELYDALIIGAGPAGLAAAVYGASEGLKTLVVDRMGPGGQAGQSSKIENYMGFPSGLPGAELSNRGYLQALKFGAEFTAPVSVVSLSTDQSGVHCVEFCTGQKVRTRTVLIATGASYRRLPVDGCERFDGAGIYYSATSVEARLCQNATAIVVGGGNSAGQAAMYLSQHAKQVKLMLRGNNLRKSMSDYLATRIEKSPNIELVLNTEIVDVYGDRRLERVETLCRQPESRQEIACAAVFSFVGAKPHTEWLPESVATDDNGFILAGSSVRDHTLWKLDRAPCELETTMPGVFAAGDVRHGTTKRCAFAVGDGALGITCVHQHLGRDS
ncbi:Thioredoxin reductase [Rubripirellula amarantea]|uniref:Thioredoxin reductase n=1 Tax=Rubripirellula amarantea TaxID=2527999 RepID=A0A5C5WJC9_9BACT|nr:cyclic nucleotide-binding domain-containing thioredoxin-disulfide reductase [Rubripirellula amarantea]TWT50868.1 Thioredoxin reductase [Rubripirellula amarantea]